MHLSTTLVTAEAAGLLMVLVKQLNLGFKSRYSTFIKEAAALIQMHWLQETPIS